MEYSQAAQTDTSPLSVFFFVHFMKKIVTHPQIFLCEVLRKMLFSYHLPSLLNKYGSQNPVKHCKRVNQRSYHCSPYSKPLVSYITTNTHLQNKF